MKGMIALLLLVTSSQTEARAETQTVTVPVPSGQPVAFIEVIGDRAGAGGSTLRFRFVAPQIARDGGTVSPEASLADIDALCEDFVLPLLKTAGRAPDQVIISLADQRLDFGAAAPDATQYFEAYRIEEQHCIWEGF